MIVHYNIIAISINLHKLLNAPNAYSDFIHSYGSIFGPFQWWDHKNLKAACAPLKDCKQFWNILSFDRMVSVLPLLLKTEAIVPAECCLALQPKKKIFFCAIVSVLVSLDFFSWFFSFGIQLTSICCHNYFTNHRHWDYGENDRSLYSDLCT